MFGLQCVGSEGERGTMCGDVVSVVALSEMALVGGMGMLHVGCTILLAF